MNAAALASIIDWFYGARGRQLVIVHPDPDKLVRCARGAIRRKWPEWIEANSLILLPKRLEDVGDNELQDALAA